MSSTPPTGPSTPHSRFTSQGHTAEDLLKEQTVGLVQLSEFRKRRAEATERASQDVSATASGASTPDLGRDGELRAAFKKKKPRVKKTLLSFGDDDGTNDDDGESAPATTSVSTSRAETPVESDAPDGVVAPRKKLKANGAVAFQAKAITKSSLAREAALKDSLRKEFLHMQEAVKATEFAIPFVFFDGGNVPGGMCRMKKGDQVWLFLEKARKMGATQQGDTGERKGWARIGVDDLMVIRNDLILPHHYEFYTFMADKAIGYNGVLFPYSAEPTTATPKHLLPDSRASTPAPTTPAPETTNSATSHITTAADRRQKKDQAPTVPDSELEGIDEDPALTRVVDRRWYERNKHVYPASFWEDFDPKKDYSQGPRRDAQGNALFFSH